MLVSAKSTSVSDSLLALERVSVYYDRFCALHDVDLSVDAGEVVSIIGANGAGKSSLLRAIVGQAPRIDGAIRYDGTELRGRTTAQIVRAGIALVPEGRRLFPSLTVEENLEIGSSIGRPGDVTLRSIYDYFPVLEEKRRQPARDLSGGQQQMVALGRALLANPRLLLCDEISLGLAPLIINELYRIVPALAARGIAILVVEQDISRSLAVADRFYCLLEGAVTLSGRPSETPREAVTQHYFGLWRR
jgi:branched-chain amino acid transport system ATP-binding protein